MATKEQTVIMENVQIIFRNFEGKEGQYNRAGDRNFGVLLAEDVAQAMAEDGWNVKRLKVREDEEDPDAIPQPWLSISVGFDKGKPPRVCMITSRGKTHLTEETVEQLDWVDMQNVDLIIAPYHWDVNGNQGVKAYLRSIYVTIEEDELERKYAELEGQ